MFSLLPITTQSVEPSQGKKECSHNNLPENLSKEKPQEAFKASLEMVTNKLTKSDAKKQAILPSSASDISRIKPSVKSTSKEESQSKTKPANLQ